MMDIIYLLRTLRLRERTPIEHAQAIRDWRLLWAWPRDGKRATLEGAGVPLMQQYADAGLDMMHEHAQFEDGGVSVTPTQFEQLFCKSAERGVR